MRRQPGPARGQTLAELAASRGIGKDRLQAAVKGALQAAKPGGAPELPEEMLDALASSIAAGAQLPPAPPRGIGQGSFPAQSILDAISGGDADARIQELLRSLERAGDATGCTQRGTTAWRTPSLGLDALA